MVNNITNINKAKESVNSDGQQYHQYQQNNFVDIGRIVDHHCLNFFLLC
jgi:hypothetical protein